MRRTSRGGERPTSLAGPHIRRQLGAAMKEGCESYKRKGKLCKECPNLDGLDKKARKKMKKKLRGN